MDNQERAKVLDKAIRKNAEDASTLKKLVEGEGGKNKREAQYVINRMIVRSETIWQYLRAIGRVLDEKKVKDEKDEKDD